MKLMWNESMKMNTVHVNDVVAAAFALAQNPYANKQCYNLVDDSQSTQGSISTILANIFNIKVDYWGETLSNLSKVSALKRLMNSIVIVIVLVLVLFCIDMFPVSNSNVSDC